MPLHLIKLCVGADSIADLRDWIERRVGEAGRHVHTTRVMPKRREEILEGGSLYWVIRGELNCRQRIVALDPVTGEDGIARCEIVLHPEVVPIDPRRRGPFQGWRYLLHHEVPPDLAGPGEEDAGLPDALRRELRVIGLL